MASPLPLSPFAEDRPCRRFCPRPRPTPPNRFATSWRGAEGQGSWYMFNIVWVRNLSHPETASFPPAPDSIRAMEPKPLVHRGRGRRFAHPFAVPCGKLNDSDVRATVARRSDRWIAEQCGVGHQLVASARGRVDESSNARPNPPESLKPRIAQDGRFFWLQRFAAVLS